MRRANYSDLTTLWHQECHKQLFATRDKLDFVASVDTCRYDNLISCDSMAYDFDLGRDLWLNRQRFTVLQREYLDPRALNEFLARCKEIGLGEAKRGVITHMPAGATVKIRNKKHRWGPCMFGFTFRGGNKHEKPTLSLHSRVTYISYMGGADLALCHVLAREIGTRIGLTPEDFAFRWHLDSSQFHFFKCQPYLLRLGLDEVIGGESARFPSADYPTLRGVRKWRETVVKHHLEGKTLEAEKYGPLRRIRRRYEEYLVGEGPPSCPIETLNFEPLYRQ